MCNYFILSITRTSDCSVLWRCDELYCYPQTVGNEHERVTMHLSINIVVKCGKCFCDLLWGNLLDNVQLVVLQLCALSSWCSLLLVLKSSLVHLVGGPWTGQLSSTTCKELKKVLYFPHRDPGTFLTVHVTKAWYPIDTGINRC